MAARRSGMAAPPEAVTSVGARNMKAKEIFERVAARAGHEAVFALDQAGEGEAPADQPGDKAKAGPGQGDAGRDASFHARPAELMAVMGALRDDPELHFDF